LPGLLPPASIASPNAPHDTAHSATLAFALGSYRFSRYRKIEVPPRSGWCRQMASTSQMIARMAEAAALARDLINTPSNDMGPEELAQAAQQLASASAPISTASSATS
jgi:leucyl aminopeptidase